MNPTDLPFAWLRRRMRPAHRGATALVPPLAVNFAGAGNRGELRGALQSSAIPPAQVCGGFVAALQERQEHVVRLLRGPDGVVGQEELMKGLVKERLRRLDRIAGEAVRLRVGVGVEDRRFMSHSARPEAA